VTITARIAGAALLLLGGGAARPAGATAQTEPEWHTTVRAGPATIQVTIRGRGDAIVCIASRGRGAEDFADLSRRLVDAGYQVILPQPRGIGGSTGPLENITYHDLAADVAAAIETLVKGPATVLGHAFGGRIARTLAADHPELVKQLILLSAPGAVPRAAAIDSLTTRFWETPLNREDRLAVIRRTFFAPGNNAGAWEGGWHFDVARAQRAADARTPRRAWWAGGSAPILVLQGVNDVIALPENARRLAAEFPGRVTVVEIPGAGHALLPEQPAQVANAILSYLRR
jgi:pimeloyl-ACP methyl ester carboxylesterase